MNPNRFSLEPSDDLSEAPRFVPQGFMAMPACLMYGPACVAGFQSQLYAWAFAQAQAAQTAPQTRTPELFGIFN